MFFPPAPDPTAQTFNWAILIFGIVVVFAFVFYFTKTKHIYNSPVEKTRAEEGIGRGLEEMP